MTEQERLLKRREIALRYARKPEAKAKARDRYVKYKDTQGYQRRVKDQTLRRKFGISLDDFERMIAEQRGACALCGVVLGIWHANAHNAPVVDHCHNTGLVRGILHRRCNAAIGMLGDSVDVVRKAVLYLERSQW